MSSSFEALLDHIADFLKFISIAQSFWFLLNMSYDHGCHLANRFLLDLGEYEALLIVAGLAHYTRFGFAMRPMTAIVKAEKAMAALAAAGAMTAISNDDDDNDGNNDDDDDDDDDKDGRQQ